VISYSIFTCVFNKFESCLDKVEWCRMVVDYLLNFLMCEMIFVSEHAASAVHSVTENLL
jgi:hypothetical protein